MLNKTFGDLKGDIQLWLNRTDLEVVNAIPAFVTLAEQEFSRAVKIPMDEGQMLYSATGTGSLSEGVEIPEDMLSPIGVTVTDTSNPDHPVIRSATRVDGYALFEMIGEEAIVEADQTIPVVDKTFTQYFAKYNNRFLFYPALPAGGLVSIIYHKDLTPMNSDADVSPALVYGYDLMLYWSLKHASVFLRDPDQEQYWTAKASEALTTMQATFDDMHWSGSPLQILGF